MLYRVVESDSAGGLEKEVEAAISQGYTPLGGVQAVVLPLMSVSYSYSESLSLLPAEEQSGRLQGGGLEIEPEDGGMRFYQAVAKVES